MKKIVVVILLVFTVSNINAQKRDIVEYKQSWDKQTVFWGYFLGINQKDYKITYQYDGSFIDVTPSMGFEVGLIGDLRLHKNINLRIEPGLSSNTKELAFTHIEGGPKDSIRDVNATYLRVPLLVKLSTDRLNNIRPYLIGGVSYDYNFSSNQDNPDDNSNGEFRMKKNNFTYEIGAGIDFYLPYFIFSPSIRGVFAINDELVRDYSSNSPWTGNVDYFGTRGIFIKFAFH
ncbi:type IX secretion/gliding motility protein PorT/SprT [Lutibacter flavus]|uniref:Probable protein-translocating porin PorT n=1 Tax=Lutibacter flavus TaxID=691689 RepID=A0A238Z6F1_9FLAO|nr:porin family protein [Lutibacter flavus]SNR78997.1 probable protein-translocating porin PorT [Lutibacter flavus]